MKDIPFKISSWRDDPHWMVKRFLNYVYEQNVLIDALDQITQRHGFDYNLEFCFFPDRNNPNPIYHFEGVTFGICDDEVIITEAECWKYVREVAAFYIARNKADAATVTMILKRIA
ncbi:MAG: ribonuclease toxin immunity protein CdiI [Pseudomonadota bacterium]